MLLSRLPSKYLDLSMLLTFFPEGEKVVLVVPAKSVAIGGKEGPWDEVSKPKHCSVSLENHTERGLFPFKCHKYLVCCCCITWQTTSPTEKQQSSLSFLRLLATQGAIKTVNFLWRKHNSSLGSPLANTHVTGFTRHHDGDPDFKRFVTLFCCYAGMVWQVLIPCPH